MPPLPLLLGGVKSYVARRTDSITWLPGPNSARYGYSVWLRHLAAIARAQLPTTFSTVVEAGPGPTMAAGVAAVLTGTERYTAVDVVPHFLQPGAAERLQEQFDTIHTLLAERAPIPAADMPLLRPLLNGYAFPHAILDDARMQAALAPERVAALRPRVPAPAAVPQAANATGAEHRVEIGALAYVCPWTAAAVPAGSADLVFSQAALQEIPHDGNADGALAGSLRAMAGWLRPGGVMSHQVDFGLYAAGPWNQHWTFGDFTWKLVRGRRSNYPNREPLSTYLELLSACGMRVVSVLPDHDRGVPVAALAPRFRALPEAERETCSAHIVAVRTA